MGDTVLVMGGGLAGIASAVRLAERGYPVILIETSKRLGGRATSHDDPETGQMLDNCQHVLLGCCVNLLDLYGRLGVKDSIEWHEELCFADRDGRRSILKSSGAPAPLHLAGSVACFGVLTLGERMSLTMGMWKLLRIGPARRHEYSDMTFGAWLRKMGQGEGVITKFWNVVIVSALNQTVDKACAAHAMQVFQDGFLKHRDGYVMGTASVPLRQLYDPAVKIIEAAGGEVHFGRSVNRIYYSNGRVSRVELKTRKTIKADQFVSALPFDRLERAIDETLRDADGRLGMMKHFEHSPILGVHLWFKEEVMEEGHLILVDSPVQWIFNKGMTASGKRRPKQYQYLHVVISAANYLMDAGNESIVDSIMEEVRVYLPGAESRKLAKARVVKEKRATFASVPGIEERRPGARGSVGNLYLAGDWCDNGWPATMEGAVRSGYEAAAAVCGEEEGAFWVEDLEASEI